MQALTARLPQSLADWLWNLTYIMAWVSLPFTIVNVVHDLGIVARFFAWLVTIIPDLSVVYAFLMEPLAEIVRVWRMLTQPIYELLLAFEIPFPMIVSDFVVLVVLLVPSLIRFFFQRSAYERSREARAAKNRELSEEQNGLGTGAGIGAGVGTIFGPLGTLLGGALGAAASGLLSNLGWAELAELSQAEAKAERRLRQARLLVHVSLGVVAVLSALLIADGLGIL